MPSTKNLVEDIGAIVLSGSAEKYNEKLATTMGDVFGANAQTLEVFVAVGIYIIAACEANGINPEVFARSFEILRELDARGEAVMAANERAKAPTGSN